MARNDIDYKEYSRLRDIAHKRIGRLEKAGYNVDISLPTVKQVRASQNPYWFMAELVKFVNAPTTLGAVRKSGASALPVTAKPRFPKVQPVPVTTAEMRKQRRRERDRLARQRRAIKDVAPAGKQGKYLGYLKAARSVAKQWQEIGMRTGDINFLQNAKWLMSMTPTQAKAFAEYAEYRFSQGDFTVRYAMAKFVEDFVEAAQSGRKVTDLQKDFDAFLADQARLSEHAAETEKLGMSSRDMLAIWDKFVRG